MAVTRSLRDRTLDTLRFSTPPVGTVLTFRRDGVEQTLTWHRNSAAGHCLLRWFRLTGWTLVSARAS